MNRKFRFNRLGYCPIQEDEQIIEINSVEIRMAGSHTPGYKKTSFYCDYANNHKCKISNDCPIYLDAPHDPHLA